MTRPLLFLLSLLVCQTLCQAASNVLVYEGEAGVGKGKHIVFVASDHEYRSEETCPAIARILAKRYGFKCTVVFGVDAQGHIKPGSSSLPGIEALDDADMAFIFVRFLAPDDKAMKHIEDYLSRGGPVLGLRTATHAFKGLKEPYARYNFRHADKAYHLGFGRQVLGETWVNCRGMTVSMNACRLASGSCVSALGSAS